MEILGWIWWATSSALSLAWSLIWFLISGWVSTLLQILLLILIVYYLKYGWQRAPVEIWRRTKSFGLLFWSWLRASEPAARSIMRDREVVRYVSTKEFGDINLSTLMTLAMLAGLYFLSHLG